MKPTSIMKAFVHLSLALMIASCGGDLLQIAREVKEVTAPEITVTALAATASQTTATITWTTSIATTHQVEYGTVSGAYIYASIQSDNPGTSHSVSLSGLTTAATYYYRVRNFYTTVAGSAASAEGTFATTAQPVIQVIGIAATSSQTTATVTWTTDVPTTHLVEYGTSTGAYTNTTIQSQTAATSHSVSLSGLSASTTYYYRVHNFHATLPEAVSAENTLATTAYPVIQVSSLAATPSQTTATITWTTDVATTHLVEYGTASGVYSLSTVQSQTAGISHSVTLSGLSASTTYYYRVHNYHTSIPETVGVENTFTTTATPQIQVSGITGTVSQTSATVTWTTDVATTHLVEYGTVSGVYTTSTIQSQSAVTSHSVTLTGLAASTQYYYRVRNYHTTYAPTVSTEGTFTTTAFPTIQVTGITSVPAQTSAVVSWTTDVATTHYVEYGTVSGTYSLSTIQTQTVVTSHSVTLSSLLPLTTYYYRVRNFHTTYAATMSAEGSFTTTTVAVTSLTATNIQQTSADITWTTDIPTRHLVEYGTVSGVYAFSTIQSQTATTSHAVSLTGLSAFTAYFYRVRNYPTDSADPASAEQTFTTIAYPNILVTVGPSATPSTTSATITWTTNVSTTHYVEYGTTSGVYDYQTTLSGTAVTSHSVTLSPLSSSTTYYYRVRNIHTTYPAIVSAEGSFATTAPSITVTGITASGITSTSANVTWTTDVATTHMVEYGTISGPPYAYYTTPSGTAITSHTVALSGLSNLTTYYYRVWNFHSTLPDVVSTQSSFATLDAPHPTLAEKMRGIWMIGGLSGSAITSAVGQVDMFDPATNTWYANITTLPVSVSFAAAESWGGKIYVVGGFDNTTNGVVQSLVQIYDVANNSWSTGSNMPGPRANIYASVVNGLIYILGGTTQNGIGSTYTASQTTYEYTPGGTWNTKAVYAAAANSERFALPFNDVIYNFGGRGTTATSLAASAHDGFAVSVNGLTGGTEVALTAGRTGIAGTLYTPTSGPAIIAIVGGFITSLTGTTGCFIVNTTSASTPTNLFQYLEYPFTAPYTWNRLATPATYPNQIGFSSSALYGSKMFVFGGTNTVNAGAPISSNQAYWFDLNTLTTGGQWTLVTTAMPIGRYGHVAVRVRQ
jgi:N-acetylneuraminic acid mutarotase